jgi:hypothetical protein
VVGGTPGHIAFPLQLTLPGLAVAHDEHRRFGACQVGDDFQSPATSPSQTSQHFS